jgi:signal peptidase I
MNFKKIWNFIWHEDSLMSWVVSILLAFILVKFIIYPLIGFALGTGYPIVAVVSGSMEHKASCNFESDCDTPIMCGKRVKDKGHYGLNAYWEICGDWYEDSNITKDNFENYSFKNGFNKGDVIVLIGEKSKDIKMGDVVVFDGNLNYPIIHRVVDKWQEEEDYYFTTKGDNNERTSPNEESISEEKIIGKAVFRLPLLGWIKIRFTEFINLLREMII